MDTIKIVSGLACSSLIALFALIFFIENPDKKLFDETVETLMVQNGLSTAQEVIDSFPELENIELKIKRISYLESRIHSITGGPAPNVSKEESLQLQGYNHEIHLLRINIKKELSQLLTSNTEVIVRRINVKQ